MPTPKKSPPSLPPGLTALQIEKAVEYVEAKAAELVDLYYEQANLFSGIVGILGVQALDTYSPYKKHKHPDIAQQRFPDLSFNGRLNPPPLEALESKGSTRPWAVQSHYDHPGWYIVWRYLVDSTKSIKAGKEVVVWRVDIVFLEKADWKYEGSTASAAGGGRTHTFGLRTPARKLLGKAVYQVPGIAIKSGKPVIAE